MQCVKDCGGVHAGEFVVTVVLFILVIFFVLTYLHIANVACELFLIILLFL